MKSSEALFVAMQELAVLVKNLPDAGEGCFYRIVLEQRKDKEQPVGLAEWVIP